MNLFACWTVDNWLSLISLFLVVLGGLFAWKQWNAGTSIKRAEFINQIIEKLRFDNEMADAMHLIEYDPNWYNEDFHDNPDSQLESSIDKLLSYLSYICYLKSTRNISKTEFEILRYEMNRVCVSPSVQAYLWNLHHFSKRNNTGCSFQYLIEYGIKNKIIKPEFKKADPGLFPKYLNF